MTRPLRLITVGIGALGETIFLFLALRGGLSTGRELQAAAIHAAASIALAWGCQRFIRQELRSASFFWFLLAMNLAMPGAALLILFATLRNQPIPKKFQNSLSIYQPTALSESPGNPPHHDHDEESSRKQQSILEILQQAEGPCRAHAILALKDVEPVQAIPLLRRALQDSDELVRIYAQNLLSRIVERVEGNTRRLERQLAESRTPSCLVRLAEQYHELVYLGILEEPEGCQMAMKKALALLEEATALEPANPHLYLLSLKYSLRNRDLSRSRRHLAEVEAMPGCTPEQLLPLKGELAFLEKDWAALRGLLKAAQPMAHGPTAAICRFWTNPKFPV